MNLSAIVAAVKETQQPKNCFNMLIYGEPKTGKTKLMATIAKVPWIKRVFWFDIENGSDTLVTMALNGELKAEETDKITVYQIPDMPSEPRAMETIMKCLTVKKDLIICEEHGKINCVACKDAAGSKEYQGQLFNIAKCTTEDVIVIDTMSALSISILNYYCLGKGDYFKPGWDEYGPQGRVLADAGLVIQNASTNFLVSAHSISVDYEENDKELEKLYPQVGTKNFSRTFAKYFSHVLYLELKLGLHKGGSSSTYRKDTVTGSRSNWKLEDQKNLDLSMLFSSLDIKPKRK